MCSGPTRARVQQAGTAVTSDEQPAVVVQVAWQASQDEPTSKTPVVALLVACRISIVVGRSIFGRLESRA